MCHWVQVFASRAELAQCALASVCACQQPHCWPALLLIVQAALAALQDPPSSPPSSPLHPDQQQLADQLAKVLLACPLFSFVSCLWAWPICFHCYLYSTVLCVLLVVFCVYLAILVCCILSSCVACVCTVWVSLSHARTHLSDRNVLQCVLSHILTCLPAPRRCPFLTGS